MNTENKRNLKTQNYTCPNCGATPEFDAKSQTLKCPFCNSIVETQDNTNICEIDIDALLANEKVWAEAEVINCANCGSKEIVTKGELSTTCSFCGTTNIVKTSEIVGMKPHGICTFKKTQKEVAENLKNWAKKQLFAPNSFKKSSKIEDLRGIYSPAFTFDCDTDTKYDGRLGETKTKTTTDSHGHRTSHSYTSYFSVSGNFKRKFDDLIIHASKDIPTNNLEDLEPFPTNECSKYNEKFLTGYTANTYAKTGNETWEDFQKRASAIVKKEILNQYDHDTVSYFNMNIKYTNPSFKYLLLPLYIGHHKYNNKNYNFYVNGCTGKVSGKAPKSPLKIFFFILGIVGILAIPFIIALLNTFK